MGDNEKVVWQFSKRITLIAFVTFAVVFLLAIILISATDMPEYSVAAITSMIGTFATLCGVIVTGYMGNSSIEKYSNAKYFQNKLTNRTDNEEESKG